MLHHHPNDHGFLAAAREERRAWLAMLQVQRDSLDVDAVSWTGWLRAMRQANDAARRSAQAALDDSCQLLARDWDRRS
jgi:hypothetical protein